MAWTQNRNQIITRALRIIGAISDGQNARQEQINDGGEALQAVLEDLNNETYWPFKIERAIQTFTASSEVTGTDSNIYTCIRNHTASADNRPITGSQYRAFWRQAGSTGGTWTLGNSYATIGQIDFASTDRVVDIINAYIRIQENVDNPPLALLDFQDYEDIANKGNVGVPYRLYVEYTDPIKMYLYPMPNDTDYIMQYTRVIKIDSMDASDSTPDMDQRLWNALIYKVAAELAYEYRLAVTDRLDLERKADKLLEKSIAMTGRGEKNLVSLGAY